MNRLWNYRSVSKKRRYHINGTDDIFVEKNGKLAYAQDEDGGRIRFKSEGDLMIVIEKIVAPINRKIDESNPIVDARLPDGSRVNVVIRPISLGGPIVTIRKFPDNYNIIVVGNLK